MLTKELKYYFPFLNFKKLTEQVSSFVSSKTEFLFYGIMKTSKYINRCVNCNFVFGSRTNTMYCSEKCRIEYLKNVQSCIVCKIGFLPKRLKQKCCSEHCIAELKKRRLAMSNRRHRNPRIKNFNRVCRVCSTPFKTNSHISQICSKECSEKVNFDKLKLFNVFERDNFRCAYCGKTSYDDGAKLIVEHIFPRSKGGTNDMHNIITACSDCNVRKNNKMMDWNIIMTLWQVVEKRNKRLDVKWDEIKGEFDKKYKLKAD